MDIYYPLRGHMVIYTHFGDLYPSKQIPLNHKQYHQLAPVSNNTPSKVHYTHMTNLLILQTNTPFINWLLNSNVVKLTISMTSLTTNPKELRTKRTYKLLI
jgi:hypothetical protein